MPGGTTAEVVDCARWLAGRPRPDVGIPVVEHPGVPREDAGWRTRVALLGGAVDAGHPDLIGARTLTWDGAPVTAHAQDARDAGGPSDSQATAYAALLVGQGRTQVRGLVPAATLLVAPVPLGPGTGLGGPLLGDEVLARAVRWAVQEEAHVIVLPFGRRRLGRRIAVTLRRATAAGVAVFAAAGDSGPSVAAFPGSVTGVTAVTGHDDDGLLPRCSTLADLAAPGAAVPGAGRSGVRPLTGSGPAAVLAAGAHAAARSQLTLDLYGSVHGPAPRQQATGPTGVTERGEGGVAAAPVVVPGGARSPHRRRERGHRDRLAHA